MACTDIAARPSRPREDAREREQERRVENHEHTTTGLRDPTAMATAEALEGSCRTARLCSHPAPPPVCPADC